MRNPDKAKVFPQTPRRIETRIDRRYDLGADHLGKHPAPGMLIGGVPQEEIFETDELAGHNLRLVVSDPLQLPTGYVRIQGDLTDRDLGVLTEGLINSGINAEKELLLPKQLAQSVGVPSTSNLRGLAAHFAITIPEDMLTRAAGATAPSGAMKAPMQEQKKQADVSRTVKVINPYGVHVKTAINIVAITTKYPETSATINFNRNSADATNRTAIVGLNIQMGDEITISASGNRDVALVTELVNLIRNQSDDTTPILYTLENAPLDLEIIGTKGMNLARMQRLGIPVPPALIVRADRDLIRGGLNRELLDELSGIKSLSNAFSHISYSKRALSVRSSSAISAPGLLTTYTDIAADCWHFGKVSYPEQAGALFLVAKSLRNFGTKVLGIGEEQFSKISDQQDFNQLLDMIEKYRGVIIDFMVQHRITENMNETQDQRSKVDALTQVCEAVKAVKHSAEEPAVSRYLRLNGLPSDLPVAVIIQQMVYGDADNRSGSFVLSTVDRRTGQEGIFVEYAKGQPGEAIVDGAITPEPIERSGIEPELIAQIQEIVKKLQAEFGQAIQVEGVIESGKLYILQVRELRRDAIKEPSLQKQEFGHPGAKVIAIGKEAEKEGLVLKPETEHDLPMHSSENLILTFEHASQRSTKLLLAALDRKLPVVGVLTKYGGTQTHFASVVHNLNHVGYDITYISGISVEEYGINQRLRINGAQGTVLPVSDDGGFHGNPEKLLEMLKMSENEHLLRKALNKNEGITATEIADYRTEVTPRTVRREFEILKALEIFVPVVIDGKVKRGYYRFADIMISEDEDYTKTLINVINNVEFQVGTKGKQKPLHRGDIPKKERPLVKEILRLHIADYIYTHIKEAKITDKPYVIKAWKGYGAQSQQSLLTKIRALTENTPFQVSFEDIEDLVTFACKPENINDRTVTILPLDERILTSEQRERLEKHGAKVMYINLDREALGANDLTPLEALVGVGRAYLVNDDNAFYRLYELLTQSTDYTRISLARLKEDPELFIRALKFILVPITTYDPVRVNERMREILIAA